MIETCVALCPLFGLLGTVTGMIEVFNAMAVQGGNAAPWRLGYPWRPYRRCRE